MTRAPTLPHVPPTTTPQREIDTDSAFARHVAEGLRAERAYLSSRFIYDERGSRIFQEIMRLDAYYLTRCEFEILEREAERLVSTFAGPDDAPFELVELGAGDGTKTKLLLRAALRQNRRCTYRPVDISGDILEVLGDSLRAELPELRFEPIAASYDEALARLAEAPRDGTRRVVLFLGSNIGNFGFAAARAFCGRVCAALRPGDLFLLGVDLRKNPRTIREAYDDPEGVTARFNLNLLHRLRRELGAEVDPGTWGFYPLYNPETGEVRSYLHPLSPEGARIRIPALGFDRRFDAGEVIHTEVSRKYSRAELDALAAGGDCDVADVLTDAGGRFADVLWERRGGG